MVTRKADEAERKHEINKRLSKVRELIGDIFAKQFNGKSNPIKPGFFCEIDDENLARGKTNRRMKGKRRGSSDVASMEEALEEDE